MIELAKQARRAKAENKTRERLRELRGEVLAVTLQRARQGPTAHRLAQMSPLHRYYDKVSRSTLSEVGYVGWVKKQLGFKLKESNPWRAEDGRDEDQSRLDDSERQVAL